MLVFRRTQSSRAIYRVRSETNVPIPLTLQPQADPELCGTSYVQLPMHPPLPPDGRRSLESNALRVASTVLMDTISVPLLSIPRTLRPLQSALQTGQFRAVRDGKRYEARSVAVQPLTDIGASHCVLHQLSKL